MSDALRFVGGDDVIEPFLLTETDGSIVDLSRMEPLTAGVWWRGKRRLDLTLQVQRPSPPVAGSGETQLPHGIYILNRTQTADIPFGRIAAVRIVAVSSDTGYVMSSYLMPLERLP